MPTYECTECGHLNRIPRRAFPYDTVSMDRGQTFEALCTCPPVSAAWPLILTCPVHSPKPKHNRAQGAPEWLGLETKGQDDIRTQMERATGKAALESLDMIVLGTKEPIGGILHEIALARGVDTVTAWQIYKRFGDNWQARLDAIDHDSDPGDEQNEGGRCCP